MNSHDLCSTQTRFEGQEVRFDTDVPITLRSVGFKLFWVLSRVDITQKFILKISQRIRMKRTITLTPLLHRSLTTPRKTVVHEKNQFAVFCV